jgi:hypothetical protein
MAAPSCTRQCWPAVQSALTAWLWRVRIAEGHVGAIRPPGVQVEGTEDLPAPVTVHLGPEVW